MELAIAQNLYPTLTSGAQLGMQIGSIGASTIVNRVTSIVEILLKNAWWLCQISRMRKVFSEARATWVRRDIAQLHTRPLALNAWFRSQAISVPVIAALALNSNLCNSMHFLQMFLTGREMATQGRTTTAWPI
jgi:hypothetical protein